MSGKEIESVLAGRLLTKREELLLPLLFAKPAAGSVSSSVAAGNAAADETFQNSLSALTGDMDPDVEPLGFLLMLSILGMRNGFKGFPASIIPRLKGIHRYCQAQNVIGMHWLLDKLRTLRSAGIPVMLIKGLAMRYYYAPGIPRIMADYDIAVPPDRFEEAMALLRKDGSGLKGTADWSDTILGEAGGKKIELDVHRWIFKSHGDRDSRFWERALPVKVRDLDLLVPCPEDMLIHQFHNHAGNIFRGEMAENRMKWLFDCRNILLFEEPSPDSLKERAAQLRATYEVRLMLLLFARIFRDRKLAGAALAVQPMTRGYVRWLQAGLAKLRFMETYDAARFGGQGPLTPERCRVNFEKSLVFYRYYRASRRADGRTLSYPAWLLWEKRIDSWAAFRDRYLGRILAMLRTELQSKAGRAAETNGHMPERDGRDDGGETS